MTIFWKELRSFKTRKRSVRANIEICWLEHFMNLLEGRKIQAEKGQVARRTYRKRKQAKRRQQRHRS